jgi:hypothetical protein
MPNAKERQIIFEEKVKKIEKTVDKILKILEGKNERKESESDKEIAGVQAKGLGALLANKGGRKEGGSN